MATFPTEFDDTIDGTAGDDTIAGLGGNDIIRGLDGGDQLEGNAGNDTLEGGKNADLLLGGEDNDSLKGNRGSDTLDGGIGDDTLKGGNGADVLLGGDGLDDFEGGNGVDTIDFSSSAGAVGISINLSTGAISNDGFGNAENAIEIENVIGSDSDDSIVGDGGDNELEGGDGADTIDGAGGNDTLGGGKGADSLIGGDGDDSLSGNRGADTLDGGIGADTLNGGNGDDVLIGDEGVDVLDGGNGVDTIDFNVATVLAGVVVDLSVGTVTDDGFGNAETLTDIENVIGTILADSITGDALGNELEGLNGEDTLIGGAGDDTLKGGQNADSILGGDDNDDISGGRGGDTLTGEAGDDTLSGGNGNDLLIGGAGQDVIDGGSGNDTVAYGGESAAPFTGLGIDATFDLVTDDILVTDGLGIVETVANTEAIIGSTGVDTIVGDGGDNTIGGFWGSDSLDGGGGTNTLSYEVFDIDTGLVTELTIDLSTGTSTEVFGVLGITTSDTFTNFQNVIGSEIGDQITGDGGANELEGRDGNDTLIGGLGSDTLMGDQGDDSLVGGEGADELFGNRGADSLEGGAANDTLTGGNGDDTLNGGAGLDVLDGGDGDDVIVYFGENTAPFTGTGINAVFTPGVDGEIQVTDPFANVETAVNVEGIIGSIANDTITGNEFDNVINGFWGSDVIDGGDGIDTASYAGLEVADLVTGLTVDLSAGTSTEEFFFGLTTNDTLLNIENVIGSGLGDNITGDGNANQLDGMDGDDTLMGGSGDDTLIGGAGNDALFGGDGVDSYDGGDGARDVADFNTPTPSNGVQIDLSTNSVIDDGFGNSETIVNVEGIAGSDFADTITGDDGDNVITGNQGVDVLDGGLGTDIAAYGAAAATAFSGPGITATFDNANDNIDVTDGFGVAETVVNFEGVFGSFADDTITGDDGDNIINGFWGSDSLDGGLGVDTLSYEFFEVGDLATGLTIDMNLGTSTEEFSIGITTNDTFTGFENVIGSGLGDTILGDAADNMIDGLEGDDFISGGAGQDTLIGGEGQDTVGYASNTPTAFAGPGITASFVFGTNDIDVTDGFGVSETAQDFEAIFGSIGSDTITGDDQDNTINGFWGSDVLEGGDGIDTVSYEGFEAADLGESLVVDLSLGKSTETLSFGLVLNDTLSGFENVIGSALGDDITGDANANVLQGEDGNDTLRGLDGDDTLIGGADNDVLIGGDGVDSLDGGDGKDTAGFLNTSPANGIQVDLSINSVIDDGFGNTETIINVENIGGTDFADTITGDAFDNFITGNKGVDLLDGGLGDDDVGYASGAPTAFSGPGIVATFDNTNDNINVTDGFGESETVVNFEGVFGSFADDTITGDDGNNRINGWWGSDSLDGGLGNNTVSYEFFEVGTPATELIVDLAAGTSTETFLDGAIVNTDTLANFQNVIGSGLGDDIRGDAGNNQLEGRDGDDTLSGADGFDTLLGGDGDDNLNGGLGQDVIDGGDGEDTVIYGGDTPTPFTGPGIVGNFLAGSTDIQVTDGFGTTETSTNVEILFGSFGNDTITGNELDNTINGFWGSDSLDGGDGIDTVGYVAFETADLGTELVIDLASGTSTETLSIGIVSTDILLNFENVIGSGLDDVIIGDGNANQLEGEAGDDDVSGGGDNDTLIGGEGDDTLRGEDGNDSLVGGAGNDALNGGMGVDSFDGGEGARDGVSFVEAGPVNAVQVDLSANTIFDDGFGNTETIFNVENVTGTDFADTITGDALDNVITGGQGLDVLDGGLGIDDAAYGGNAAVAFSGPGITATFDNTNDNIDIVDGFGVAETVVNFEGVIGSFAEDTITGDDGNNRINGFWGSDILDGGLGVDTLSYEFFEIADLATGLTVDMNLGTTTEEFPIGITPTDTFAGFENVIGSGLGDTITGDGNDNLLDGADGEDFISGGAGQDTLIGGEGFDTVGYGGNTPTPFTGPGIVATFVGGTTNIDVTDGFGVFETAQDFEAIFGSIGNDTVTGNELDNTINGFWGSDVLEGGDGIDTVSYEAFEVSGLGVSLVVDLSLGTSTETLSIGIVSNDSLSGFENVIGSALDDEIIGDANANLLRGEDGDDTLTGGDGDDTLEGGTGNDVLQGGLGVDSLNGGEGDRDLADFLAPGPANGVQIDLSIGSVIDDGFGNSETITQVEGIIGTDFNDTITGDSFDNVIAGNQGVDVLDGGFGIDDVSYVSNAATAFSGPGITATFDNTNDNIDVTDGFGVAETVFNFEGIIGSIADDTITGDDGDNRINGFWGSDSLDGGLGVNTLSYEFFEAADLAEGLIVDLTEGTSTETFFGGGIVTTDTIANFQNVIGSGLGDDIRGDANNNNLEGRDGDDTLAGFDGDDTLLGGDGDDILNGGAGTDSLVGGAGFDVVAYGNETTAPFTGTGVTAIFVAGVEDQIQITDPSAIVEVATEVEAIVGSIGNDTITGNEFDNTISGFWGSDSLDGGDGIDTLSFRPFDAGGIGTALTVDLAAGTTTEDLGGVGLVTNDTIANFENVIGSGVSDTIIGDAGANQLEGEGGEDRLDGGDGDDTLLGGDDDDALIGGDGSDSLDGGAGRDSLDFNGLGVTTGVVVDLSANEVTDDGFGNTDFVINVEGVIGSELNDTITGDSQDNFLQGAGGVDVVDGVTGFDTVLFATDAAAAFDPNGITATFDNASDNIQVTDGFGNVETALNFDAIIGSFADDTITGDDGANQINGWWGNDTLDGGLGNDTVSYEFLELGGLATSLTVDLSTGMATETFAGGGIVTTDTLSNFFNVIGSGLSDTIIGDANNNVIQGGVGDDTMTGGTGSDTFVFEEEDGNDTITDFVVGTDGLELRPDLTIDSLSEADVNGDLTLDTVVLLNTGQEITLLGVSGVADPADLLF